MKKKIVAAALAVAVAFNLVSLRPRATGAAAVGISVGVLALNLMYLLNGGYDGYAEAIGSLIENGVEGFQKAFIGSENCPSWFASGWQQIYYTVSGWFDSGELTVDENGKVALKYEYYKQLYDELSEVVAPSVDLGSSIAYELVSYPINTPISFAGCKKLDSFYILSSDAKSTWMTYVPCYYTADNIYFSYSGFYLQGKRYASNSSYGVQYTYTMNISAECHNTKESSTLSNGVIWKNEADAKNYSLDEYLTDCNASFYFNGSKCMVDVNPIGGTSKHGEISGTRFFKYDGSTRTNISVDEIPDNASFGYFICDGIFHDDFIKTLKTYTSTPSTDLDDLSNVLPLDKTTNPTLVIDTDPAITVPTDAVTVTDVPGQADMTLTDYKTQTRLDIDIPSVISTKFPFCIPFDFIRVISVLCADPVAPVFRIPISTDPENLKGFEGNQTIGELPEDFTPMFEIDEELVLDLSAVPLVQPVGYTVFIISFVVLLIFCTNKMINH